MFITFDEISNFFSKRNFFKALCVLITFLYFICIHNSKIIFYFKLNVKSINLLNEYLK